MNFKMTVIPFTALALVVLPNTLHSRVVSDASFSMDSSFYKPIDDDSAIRNDCDYCHGTHGARKDAPALLNDREEHYSRYLNSTDLSGGGQPVYGWDSSRKCPRSKVRNRR